MHLTSTLFPTPCTNHSATTLCSYRIPMTTVLVLVLDWNSGKVTDRLSSLLDLILILRTQVLILTLMVITSVPSSICSKWLMRKDQLSPTLCMSGRWIRSRTTMELSQPLKQRSLSTDWLIRVICTTTSPTIASMLYLRLVILKQLQLMLLKSTEPNRVADLSM